MKYQAMAEVILDFNSGTIKRRPTFFVSVRARITGHILQGTLESRSYANRKEAQIDTYQQSEGYPLTILKS